MLSLILFQRIAELFVIIFFRLAHCQGRHPEIGGQPLPFHDPAVHYRTQRLFQRLSD